MRLSLNNDPKLAVGQPNRKYLLKILIFVSIFFDIYDTREKILGYMWGICAGFGLGKKSRFAKNIRAKRGKKLPTGENFLGFVNKWTHIHIFVAHAAINKTFFRCKICLQAYIFLIN